jgi:gamma-polyglutamate synthase
MNRADLLEEHIAPRLRSAMSDLRDEVIADSEWSSANSDSERAAALIDWTEKQFATIAALHAMAAEFEARFRNTSDDAERDAAILDFAWRMGSRRRSLDRDAKALAHFFDADAVLERYHRRVGERERATAYGLERIGEAIADGIEKSEISNDSRLLSAAFAPLFMQAVGYRGDARVRVASLHCLLCIAQKRNLRLRGFWVDTAVRDVRRIALNANDEVWAQCKAFAILLILSPVSLQAVLERRLAFNADQATPIARDNRIFARRYLAALLVDNVTNGGNWLPHILGLAKDSDGSVRQAMAIALPRLMREQSGGVYALLRMDRDPQVRAALFASPQAMIISVGADRYLTHILRTLSREQDEFVLRMTMRAAEVYCKWGRDQGDDKLHQVAGRLRLALSDLRQRSGDLKIRRWAGMTSEMLWLMADDEAYAISIIVTDAISGVREGRRKRVSALQDFDTNKVARVLSVLAVDDFGFDYSPGTRPRVRRGDQFKRRAWRFLYEIRQSSTDKRQAWLHTIGRKWSGPIAAPPAHMAELAPTKVPGEPLFQASEAGWRNYVPLLDHVLSAIDQGGETRLFSSEGITTIAAPKGLFQRLKAFWQISWSFARLASLRNDAGNVYAAALRQYGVTISHAPHADDPTQADPQVARFFELGSFVTILSFWWDDAVTYFATVYQNSIPQLAAFLALAGGWFVARHIWRARKMRRLRNGISLVLGGWGTRGKSGTERLKAGLINAIGLPLVSKTTGCEAMFLHGTAYGDLKEMFLFRPYDKATIWEQYDLVGVSRGLGARAFLWECMGLTPSYVRVLQKDWMRDDISTITNTYPDHEDVQGPAGRNIPEVMTQFIPDGGTLLTTEEEMLPILREGAMLSNTRLRAIGWKEAGLIHQDLLQRFPYAEHPFNIALVTAMADEMGLASDYAVKEMSDRVVADLGVLKIYPRATINGRTLEYVMGNSANERFGAMGNWQRMGFEHHNLSVDPEIFVSTVVNNRADRVPRSRVFARILVEDVAADCHVLIGSNIDGLLGFIDESWLEYAKTLTLFDETGDPLARLERLAKQQRVPISVDEIVGRLKAMLGAQSTSLDSATVMTVSSAEAFAAELNKAGIDHADDIAAHAFAQRVNFEEYSKLRDAVASNGSQAQIDESMRGFLRKIFMAKLVPVHEYYTPGEDIVRMVAQLTPPGLVNRIMGMQNIKGTGLDFVYRWQAWESCYKACEQAVDADPAIARRGISFLSAFQEYSALSEGYVRDTISKLREGAGGSDISESAIDAIIARMDSQLAALNQSSGTGGGNSGNNKLVQWLETFWDPTDAIFRRKRAEKIYRAMIAEQISSQRAALELKKLTSRQKGGWLSASLANIRWPLRGASKA